MQILRSTIQDLKEDIADTLLTVDYVFHLFLVLFIIGTCLLGIQWLEDHFHQLTVHLDLSYDVAEALGGKMPEIAVLMNNQLLEYFKEVVDVVSDRFEQEFERKREQRENAVQQGHVLNVDGCNGCWHDELYEFLINVLTQVLNQCNYEVQNLTLDDVV